MHKGLRIYILLGLCYCILSTISAKNSNSNDPALKDIAGLIECPDNDTTAVRKIIELIESLPTKSWERYEYTQKGLDMAYKSQMREETGILYYDLAWYYFVNNDKDSTIASFIKAVEYSTNPEILIFSYGCISNNYSWSNQHDLAMHYAQLSYDISLKSNSQEIIADALMFMGDAYRYQGKMDEAKKYYQQSWETIYDFNVKGNILSILYVSINVYLGNTSYLNPYSSFDYAMSMKEVYDSSSQRKKQILVFNLVKAFDSSVFTTDNLKTQSTLLIQSIIIIIFLIIIGFLLFIQIVVKRKANKKLKKANEIKSQLFLILSHDLRQPIISLISFLELKKNNPNISKDQIKILDQKTLEALNSTLKSMEDFITWSKNQMNSFELEPSEISLSKIFADNRSFFEYENKVTFQYKIPNNLYLKTDENHLKTIIRNLTLNSIAVSLDIENPIIIWEAKKIKRNTILSIQNFGAEMEKKYIDILLSHSKERIASSGAGLVIIRDLAQAINCKIEVETSSQSGTKISLIF